MKKILVLLLALSMLAALLPAAAVAAEPTDLTFWTYVELHSEFFEDAARRWNGKKSRRINSANGWSPPP